MTFPSAKVLRKVLLGNRAFIKILNVIQNENRKFYDLSKKGRACFHMILKNLQHIF